MSVRIYRTRAGKSTHAAVSSTHDGVFYVMLACAMWWSAVGLDVFDLGAGTPRCPTCKAAVAQGRAILSREVPS